MDCFDENVFFFFFLYIRVQLFTDNEHVFIYVPLPFDKIKFLSMISSLKFRIFIK